MFHAVFFFCWEHYCWVEGLGWVDLSYIRERQNDLFRENGSVMRGFAGLMRGYTAGMRGWRLLMRGSDFPMDYKHLNKHQISKNGNLCAGFDRLCVDLHLVCAPGVCLCAGNDLVCADFRWVCAAEKCLCVGITHLCADFQLI
ncbi:hypothetical protein HNO89_000830 [Sporosarcina luteola]|nr:hypothetical protein [Sporosarcina luteola]